MRLDQLRSRLREKNYLAAESENTNVDFQIDSKSALPDEGLVTREMIDQMRIVLAEMESNQAQAFCLAHFEKLSYAEIAEQLGVTVKRVGVLLGNAKETLRKRLKEYNPIAPSELKQ